MTKHFSQSEKDEIKTMHGWGVQRSDLKEMFGTSWPQLERILNDDPSEPTIKGRPTSLNIAIVRNIRRLHADGWTRKEIASETGVPYSTVRSVIKGHRWAEVE